MCILNATHIKPISFLFFFFQQVYTYVTFFCFYKGCTAPFIKNIETKNWGLLNFNFEFCAFIIKIILNSMNRIGFATAERDKSCICNIHTSSTQIVQDPST